MYLIIDKVDGHIEENNGNKYLVFDSRYENEEVFKKYTELWDGIKNEIVITTGGKKGEYGKDFMKIRFNTDDKLPLKLQLVTVIFRRIFEEDGKFYSELYLDDSLYVLCV